MVLDVAAVMVGFGVAHDEADDFVVAGGWLAKEYFRGVVECIAVDDVVVRLVAVPSGVRWRCSRFGADPAEEGCK